MLRNKYPILLKLTVFLKDKIQLLREDVGIVIQNLLERKILFIRIKGDKNIQ